LFAYLKQFLFDRRPTSESISFPTDHLGKLRSAARYLSFAALSAVGAESLIENAVNVSGDQISIGQTVVENPDEIYVITLGKAGLASALALDHELRGRITRGICISLRKLHPITSDWQMFGGGHPVPNSQSLSAAEACFDLLREANNKNALVIFVVSGGGSAMLEWPVNPDISLDDLQQANHVLVTCGATINEINVVRRAFSAVKGGKLAACAPNAQIVTLIISDTNPGDEASVASGPTLPLPSNTISASKVVQQYQLESKLPDSILRAIAEPQREVKSNSNATHYVLADNSTAVAAAARAASEMRFRVVIADDISEQEISEGCAKLLSRLDAEQPPVCVISGGEFSCVVRGEGRGGRNLETVLTCAPELEHRNEHIVVLSEATDGVDGNSRVAGAIADNRTMERARALGLDASEFLARSDSFAFLEALGDTFGQGPSHTNVRDIRILIKTARDCDEGLDFGVLEPLC